MSNGHKYDPLVQEGLAAPRQPVAKGISAGSGHCPLRLHPRPLVRGLIQRWHQQVEVSECPGDAALLHALLGVTNSKKNSGIW